MEEDTLAAVERASSQPAARAADAAPAALVPPADAENVAETVAEKLARIRQAVARSRAEQQPLLNSVFAEDERAEDEEEVGGDAADTDNEPDFFEEVEDLAETFEEDEVDASEEVGDETAEAEEVEQVEAHVDEGDEVDALDAMITETAAEEMVSEPEVEAAQDEDAEPALEVTVEDEVANDAAVDPRDALDTLNIEDLAAHLEEPSIEGTEEDVAAQEAPELDDIAAMLDRNEEMAEDNAAVEDAAAEIEDEEEDALDAFTAKLDEAVANAEDDDAADDNAADPTLDDISALLADGPGADSAEERAALSDDDAEPLILAEADRTDLPEANRGLKVRVVKMKRDDFEQMFEEDGDDEPGEAVAEASTSEADPNEAGICEAFGETGLSTEDEEDLIRELMAVERDTESERAEMMEEPITEDAEADIEVAEEEAEVFAEEIADAESETPQAERPRQNADDASVDRLLARADTALEEDEGSRRRSAIAHLKAAVAAVRADGDDTRRGEEQRAARTLNQFRQDLASVVRPSKAKAETEEVAAEEPASEPSNPTTARERARRRMPPLMLVSEQRIDKPEADASAEPVRPRRVQADDMEAAEGEGLFDESGSNDSGDGNVFAPGGDFAAYVAELGAEGTKESLEASLAYGLFVDGAEFNSRPQIMRRMLSLFPEGSVTREDGLRAFGVLLREGRIIRQKRSQFVLPEGHRYTPQPNGGAQANSA